MNRDWAGGQALSVVLGGEARSHQFLEMRCGYKRTEDTFPKYGKGLGELLQGFKEMSPGAPPWRELGEHLVVAWGVVGFPSTPVTGGPMVSSQ